MKTDITVF